MKAFASCDMSAEVLREYLSRQLALHDVMEPALRCWFDRDLADARLIKADWLRHDLQALGATASPFNVDWASPTTQAEAFGCLYVLEGATLGLRTIARSLPEGHCALSSSGRFLSGYREGTGVLWKDLIAILGTVETAAWPQAVEGARRTFDAYQAVFSGWRDERVSS